MFPIYLDEDSMRRDVVRPLRADRIEIRTTSDVAMRGAPDDRQLAYAAGRGWVIVTANQKDYARLHKEWMAAGQDHAGIVICPQSMPIGAQLRALRHLLSVRSTADMVNTAEYLTGWLDDPQ